MLVKEISYKFEVAENFQVLPIRHLSGMLTITGSPNRSGTLHKAECDAYISSIDTTIEEQLYKLTMMGGIFLIIDNLSNAHLLGSDETKAALSYTKINAGQPGGQYGYTLKITYQSPIGIPVQSFNPDE